MTRSQAVRATMHSVLALPRHALTVISLTTLLVSGPGKWVASQTAPGTAPLPRLTLAGVELAPIQVDPAHVDIRVTVDLGGDVPLASFIAARPRGLPALQRTTSGTWVAWDQRPESLIDNHFASSDGKLIFAATGADFSRQSFPIAISVAYRTLAGVKFGLISMTPKP
jgi:hypothetical protein